MNPRISPPILKAANELFRRHGYAAVHMDDIAKELGMSKKTLYQHVKSKETLLLAICNQLNREFEQHFRDILDSKQLSLTEKLFLHIEFCNAKLNRLHSSFILDIKRHCPAVYPRLQELRRDGTTRTIAALLQQGQKEGLVRKDLSIPLITESFLHVVFNVMEPEALDALKLSPSQAHKQVLELFFNGILIRNKAKKCTSTSPARYSLHY